MYWVIILGQFFATKLMDDDCYLNYVRGTNALSCCPPPPSPSEFFCFDPVMRGWTLDSGHSGINNNF